MSLRSGVPPEFERVGRFSSKQAAKLRAAAIRSEGYRARVVADPAQEDFVVFKGSKRSRKAQGRWSG